VGSRREGDPEGLRPFEHVWSTAMRPPAISGGRAWPTRWSAART
jgi:hypothetical protein